MYMYVLVRIDYKCTYMYVDVCICMYLYSMLMYMHVFAGICMYVNCLPGILSSGGPALDT